MTSFSRYFAVVYLLYFFSASCAQDSALFGRSIHRNNVCPMVNVNLDFDLVAGRKVKWSVVHGNGGYSSPVIGGGRILISTNNNAGYRPKHRLSQDRGVMICFEENTGKFLWQLTRKKLASGRVNDWPTIGMISCACIQEDRAYVVTNRAELMCLDMNGFSDGKNDGPYQGEEDKEVGDADIIWSLDMIQDLDVFPHNLSVSSPVVYKDHVFVITGNGVDETHRELPSPDAPSFICVDKRSGKVIWQDNSPGKNIMHGSWSSPCIGLVNGKAQVCMPGGDGWLYSFDATAKEKKLLWKFDANLKKSKWILGGRKATRNNIIGTPVFYKNSFVFGTGQDLEHGTGAAFMYRVDATGKGDVSNELGDKGKQGRPNSNSRMIWRYGGTDVDGTITGEKGPIFNRTVSTAVVHEDLVYIGDSFGYFHCVDFRTGKNVFVYDSFSMIAGSALVADDKVFFGTEDGDLFVLKHGRTKKEIKKLQLNEAIYTTPTIANRVLYVLDRKHLHAIDISK